MLLATTTTKPIVTAATTTASYKNPPRETFFRFFFSVPFTSVLTSEALHPCPSSQHPYLGHAQDSSHVAASPAEVCRRRSQIVGGLAIRRRQCTAAGSLRWCSRVPVLIQHTQNTPFCAPADDIVSYVAESDLMSILQRVDRHCIPPPIVLCGLALKVLMRTASGREGGRNTETEVATTAWHKGPQKQRQYYKLLCYG